MLHVCQDVLGVNTVVDSTRRPVDQARVLSECVVQLIRLLIRVSPVM
jgi:hypothetical protein